MELLKRKNVDFLVQQFWRKGYLTLSRKFGTFLPEPDSVGGFEIDVIARQKNRYAIGLTIDCDEIGNRTLLINKIRFLATRHTKYGSVPVMLFICVRSEIFESVKFLLNDLEEDIRKNIKLFQLIEPITRIKKRREEKSPQLFS
jgi:hypothetical protein